MTTQVIFKIDKKLKDQAMKKAQNQGIAFSSILKMATQAYIVGDLELQLVVEPRFNERTKKLLARELKDIKEGKNISPGFDNAKDAVDYLKKLEA
jgi:antitoxin component of RelBE/YafQ-DinJ toxin-antitoxin module